jgi:hypothetical protein
MEKNATGQAAQSGDLLAPLTPDGRPMRHGLCTCSSHCANSPYHEKACCNEVWCDCWCHADEYANRSRNSAICGNDGQ